MSPTSTARNSNLRKISLCAAALVVTLLPTACGSAYADVGHAGHSTEVVKVGDSVAAPSEDGENGGDAEEAGAEEAGAEQGDAEGGEADPAEEAGAGEDAGADNNQDNQNDQGRNDQGQNEDKDKENQGQDGENTGDEAGAAKNEPGNGRNGKQEPSPGNNGGGNGNNGLEVLGTDCSNSQLEPHDGFEEAPRCVETSFGEVAAEEKSPSLLISDAPQTVNANEEFTISVSTRNLIRDRFLGAAAGGYYLESSFLNEDGIQRGHFHTACRMLESTSEAPDAAPDPEFFVATQDNGGGEAPDNVEITVSGMPETGTAQCAVWAGDGSHRIPMMQRANQTPAFDAVRITIQ